LEKPRHYKNIVISLPFSRFPTLPQSERQVLENQSEKKLKSKTPNVRKNLLAGVSCSKKSAMGEE